MVRSMPSLRRLLLLLVAAGLAGVWLRRLLDAPEPQVLAASPEPLRLESVPEIPPAPEPPPPAAEPVTVESDAVVSPLEAGPVTDEMNAIPLPLEEELAFVDAAEPDASTPDADAAGPQIAEEWVSPEPEQDAGEEPEPGPPDAVVTEEEAATTDPDEELASVEAAELEVRQVDPADEEAGEDEDAGADASVDIVDVVDDLLEQPSAQKPATQKR
jgi:hypothetical protein